MWRWLRIIRTNSRITVRADADYAAKDVTERIDNASEKKYDALLESHLEDYQELFARVELDLGGTYNADEETDQLLSAWNSNSSKGTQKPLPGRTVFPVRQIYG